MKGQKAKQGAKGTENLLGESKSQAQGKFKAEQLEIKKIHIAEIGRAHV